jgi:hypothetical protein
MDYSTLFPRLYTRPDIDRLFTACEGVDGSSIAKTFLTLQLDTGKRIRDVIQMAEFRTVLEDMIDGIRERAGGAT